CAPGCPVKALDEQSGVTKDTPHQRGPRHGNVYDRGKGPSGPDGVRGFEGAGGASRFFPSFEGQEPPDAPFFYTGKASKRETTLGGQVGSTRPGRHPDSLVMPPEGYRPSSTLGVGSHVLAADGRLHGVEAVTQHPDTSEALV